MRQDVVAHLADSPGINCLWRTVSGIWCLGRSPRQQRRGLPSRQKNMGSRTWPSWNPEEARGQSP